LNSPPPDGLIFNQLQVLHFERVYLGKRRRPAEEGERTNTITLSYIYVGKCSNEAHYIE
jgi:hypothetical protein